MARHTSIAEQLKGFMAYRTRPETKEPIVPVKSNWTVIPANDNVAPEEIVDFGFERKLLITPSVKEIMLNVDGGDVERNDNGQEVRIGRLSFSDGTQTERAYTHGPEGKLVQYDARMPTGAMLGCREKADSQLGGRGDSQSYTEQSNLYFAQMLGAIEPRYIKGGKRKNGKSCTADEARGILVEAYANTPVMPKVKKFKKGLPCASPRVADSFLGMQKGKKGESGTIMWQDIAGHIVQREIWEAAMAYVSDNDVETLDAALEAKTFADIGGTGSKRAAERRGKRRLLAANDNICNAMNIFA